MAILRAQVLVVGAGVVGLAVASHLAQCFALRPLSHRRRRVWDASVLVVDKNLRIGDETSSRNSEVIHAGFYYPLQTLKSRHCVRGRFLLYDFCRSVGVPHARCGKWLVSASGSDQDRMYFNELQLRSKQMDIPFRPLSQREITSEEPRLRVACGFASSSSGIVDSHALMQSLEGRLLHYEGLLSLRTSVDRIQVLTSPSQARFKTTLRLLNNNNNNDDSACIDVHSDAVVNCGGLWAEHVARRILNEQGTVFLPESVLQRYRLQPSKGRYYTLTSSRPLVRRLIYPTPPDRQLSSLGIHLTLDLQGRIRLGPDSAFEPVDSNLDYELPFPDSLAELELRRSFWTAVTSYLPLHESEDRIRLDYAGLRPRLMYPTHAEGFRDFIVEEGRAWGAEGLVNLVGIESPGLTACLSLAEQVEEFLLKDL